MAYALRSIGAYTSIYDTAFTPAMPAGFAANDLLLLHAGEALGSDFPPTVSGWTLLTASGAGSGHQHGIWGRLATGSGDQPTVPRWNNSNWMFGCVAAYTYSGVLLSLGSIVHAS